MNTNNIIEIRENKKLKLHNVLKKELTDKELSEFPKTIPVFQGYIKARGMLPVGPIITYATPYVEDGVIRNKIELMAQMNQLLHNEQKHPYSFIEDLLVSNCLFARYTGPQEYSYLANYKLQVYAFENNYKLKGSIYTVFTNGNQDEITVDVFAEMENE